MSAAVEHEVVAGPAPLMRADAVQVRIGGLEIVRHADLRLRAGEVVSLVGPNGAGKSTFARTIAGLQSIASGSVHWQGDDGRRSGRQLARLRAFVPQHAPVPPGMTVREAVDLGRAPHIGALRRPGHRDRAIAAESIERVGAGHLAGRTLATLSGGELQRVRVAVALAQEAPCLILDEPTSSLDLGAAARLGRLLREVADAGLGVLVVLQDLALAAAISDAVVVMHGGRTVAAGPPALVLTTERLAAIWQVDAQLTIAAGARPGTALHIDWLATAPGAARADQPLEARP